MDFTELEIDIKEYGQIQKQINELEKKRLMLKDKILAFLDNNKTQSMKIGPHKVWYTETPKYAFNNEIIFNTIGHHSFFEIVKINAFAFNRLLKDKSIDDESIKILMDSREVVSLSKSLYIK